MVIVEGHGEVEACRRLVNRTLVAQGHKGDPFNHILSPRRYKIGGAGQLELACEYARSQRPAGLLITSDWEDGCPKSDAPGLAARVRALNLPFPSAVVLFYREYETLAVSIASQLAGKALRLPDGTAIVLDPGASTPANPESPRDAKQWVRENLFSHQAYKPTTHQLPLTAMMQPSDLRAAGLSSFRRLERALDHLVYCVKSGSAAVYP